MFEIVAERPQDAAPRDQLLDLAFGPERGKRTVYRLREGAAAVAGLSFVVLEDGTFSGSLRFWPVRLGGAERPILLGPLAVDPERRGQAVGVALVRRGLREAKRLGHDIVLVVGAPHYYQRFGFGPATPYGLTLPGPVDPERFQIRALRGGALRRIAGPVERVDVAKEREKEVANGPRGATPP